jgi:hypothetical protein
MSEKKQGSLAAPRTHQPHWKDSTVTQRQQGRRAKLDAIAQASGYSSWSEFETACLNGTTQPTQRAGDTATPTKAGGRGITK